MLERVRTLFRQIIDPSTSDHALTADEAQVAAVALMCHVMGSDGVIEDEERATLRRIVEARFGLDAEATEALIAEAQASDQEAIDLYGFTSILKRHLEREDRLSLIRAIWELVYADGGVHELEDNLVWRIADLLGIDQDERIALKQSVRRG